METPPIQGPVFLIETDRISPNPQQPRRDFNEEELRELATSIREFGILQPIVVTKVEQDTEIGTNVAYQLIAGERRWRAAKLIGLERIPAIIKSINLERDRLELAIIENVQRADLNPIEAARAYTKLQDEFRLTQREIASRIGKSREVVANTIRLLDLPSHIQEAVAKQQLSESQGRLLLTVDDPQHQQMLFEDILHNNVSVRELKSKIVRLQVKTKSAEATPGPIEQIPMPAVSPEVQQLQNELERALGAPVRVEQEGEKAKLTIAFYSTDELRALVQKLTDNILPPSLL